MTKKAELTLRDDPKKVREPAVYKRLELMLFDEACHHSWGCALYRLYRKGIIDNEQRMAGDRYESLVADQRRLQEIDPDAMEDDREWWLAKVKFTKKRYNEVVEILGFGRKYIDKLILDNEHLWYPKEQQIARDGLQLLANFFARGRNKARTGLDSHVSINKRPIIK